MYYLELIQRFWEFNKSAKISPTEISLYFYLLKIGYENERYDFKISDVKLGKELGLTRKTIKSTKEKLKRIGLIQFQSKNGIPCHYRLLLNFSFDIESKKLSEKEENTNNEEYRKKEFLKAPKYIFSARSTVDLVQKNENKSAKVVFLETSKEQRHSQGKEQKLNEQNHRNSEIPSLDEFMEYAKSLEDYEKKLEFFILEKYESWKNNGWKNNSNRPISNWKSTIKSTLPYLKNSIEENPISLQDIPNIKHPEPYSKYH